MKETRVLLLRHAETAAPDRFHGAESDVGLGERGRSQAEAVARELATTRPEALYCSGMRRALETAAPIGRACGLVPQVIEALHEGRMGTLSGLLLGEGLAAYELARQRWMAGDVGYNHEGGESYADIRDRVLPAFRQVVDRHPGQTLVIVAHGTVIRVLLTTLLEGYGPADFRRIDIDNCGINDLRGDGTRWRAVSLNQWRLTEEG